MMTRLVLSIVLLLTSSQGYCGPLNEPDPNARDYFGRLGIDPLDPDLKDPDLALSLVEKAYRSAVRKYHPDLNPEDPDGAFKTKNIIEAYETLKVASARNSYILMAEYRHQNSEEYHEDTAKALEQEAYNGMMRYLDDLIEGRRESWSEHRTQRSRQSKSRSFGTTHAPADLVRHNLTVRQIIGRHA